MSRIACFLSPWAAVVFGLLGTATPASGQNAGVESRVRAHSIDDHDPVYNVDCEPSPNADPVEDGCACEGPNYPQGTRCMSDWLFALTNLPGQRIEADSYACAVGSCAITPLPQDGLGVSETDFASNFVDVYADTFTEDPYIYDSGGAVSIWFDELTVSGTASPGATIRANLRVRGSWQNGVCFVVNAMLARSDVLPAVPRHQVQFGNTPATPDPICIIAGPMGVPPEFTDYGEEDGAIDLVVPVEIPLVAPSKVFFASELRAFAEGTDARLDGPNGGLEMTVESLRIPAGVDVSSEAGALAAYNVPAPSVAASGVIAFAALATRRPR